MFEHAHRRFNPLTGEWILVSPHRMKRPWQGRTETVTDTAGPAYDPDCYLCPRNKRSSGAINPDYDNVFVFTNDFPALTTTGEQEEWEDGLLRAQSDQGTCRVVCFSPDHSRTLAELTLDEIVGVIRCWQEEFAALSSMEGIRNVQIFENKGELLGCSNPHPHGQIWAESRVPVQVENRRIRQHAYFNRTGATLLGDYLAQERRQKERIIASNDHFSLLIPFWAVWPYEAMVIAHRPVPYVTELNDKEVESFAEMLSVMTIRYDNLFQTSFPYSAGMMNAPLRTKDVNGWHFHFSFYPPLLRSATVRKFMVGYEMFANPQRDFTPEYAAGVLRALPGVHYRS